MKTLKLAVILLAAGISLNCHAQTENLKSPPQVYQFCRSNPMISRLGGNLSDFCECFTSQLTEAAKFLHGNFGDQQSKTLIVSGPMFYCAAKIKNMDSVAVLRAIEDYSESQTSRGSSQNQQNLSESSLLARGAPLNIRDPQAFNTFCLVATNSPRYAAAVQSGRTEALCQCSYAKLKRTKHPVQEMDLIESLDSCLSDSLLITR